MSNRDRLLKGYERARTIPDDLAVVLALVALTDVFVLVPAVGVQPIRIALSLVSVLVLPGYALVAALFPEGDSTETESTGANRPGRRVITGRLLSGRSIDGLERALLSVGTSIAVVPLIGLVLDTTPLGLRLVPITLSVSTFTVVAAIVGVRRRWALPEAERFDLSFRWWLERVRAAFVPETRLDSVLDTVLVASLLILAVSVGYTLAVPSEGERFTEFYLLTEDDSGELVADGYPTTVAPSETEPLVVGVSNNEGESTNYTIVVELQRIEPTGNTTAVVEQRQLHRFEMGIEPNETKLRRHTVTPPLTGQRLRLMYLLYRGPAPQNPTIESAYRETHLWIDVPSNRTSAQRNASMARPLSSPAESLVDRGDRRVR